MASSTRRKLSRLERILVGSIVSVALVLVVALAATGWALKRYSPDRENLNVQESSRHEPQNFLIVGSDTRDGLDMNADGAEALTGEKTEGKRSDTMMIARLDIDRGRIDLLSLPRDLWVTLPDGEEHKMNAAYNTGAQTVIDTVQQNFNIPIHHYAEVSFAAFFKLVEALNGVPIYINRPIKDKHSGLNLPQAGCVRLDPYQALAFSRSRELAYKDAKGEWHSDPTGDAGRITRQQVFLRQAAARVADLGLDDVLVIDRVASAVTSSVILDDSLSVADLLALAREFKDFDPADIQTHTLATDEHVLDNGSKVQLLDETQAEPIFDIFRGLSTPPKINTNPVLPEHLSVQVLNGTGTTGKASEAAAELSRKYFVISGTGNPASGTQATSEIHYPAGANASAVLLSTYVTPAPKLVQDDTVVAGHLTLILGSDYAEVGTPPPTTAQVLDSAAAATTAAPSTTAAATTTISSDGEDSTTTTAKPLPGTEAAAAAALGPLGFGVEVGVPPPGVKCD